MDTKNDLEISRPVYEWTARAISVVKKRLGVNIKLHHSKGQIEAGQIFLFNHFARFETFIPQYLIFQETGALCRSVGAAELFRRDDAFSNYLRNIGAVPNDLPGLLPFLAKEILRGRKIIVFPEGGMVKDRQVLDSEGRYSIYSRTARERRKHHTGAAVLAFTLEAFKAGILAIHEAGDLRCLESWTERLGLETVEDLVAAVRRPTLIVPANITFYPIRVSDNILRKGVEFFTDGLSKRFSEELLIEGNILLKQTDMDVRLGDAVAPAEVWQWWERQIFSRLIRRIDSLDDFFALKRDKGRWDERLVAMCVGRKTLRVRDAYMREMYAGVTINLSHLISRLILMFVDKGQTEVGYELFHKALYLAIKNARKEPSIHLHQSLKNPDAHTGVVDGRCPGLEQFMSSKACSGLVERDSERYRFLPKLCEEHEFDQVRLENLISVYANEMAPILVAKQAVEKAMNAAPALDDRALAYMLFNDELDSYAWDRQCVSDRRCEELKRQETATESGEPYLSVPEASNGLGIVLVHGFLASPAELRAFAKKLEAAGHPVVGVRLKGHGTSPWDLRDRSWQDWLESVRRGYRIMSAFADRICLVGFSSGGALALHLAAEQPERLAGVAAVSAPMKFRNKNLIFVPLVHGATKLTRWVSSFEGIMPFLPNKSEHPHINYRNIPIRGLYELRRMVDELDRRLPDVQCPVILVQGTEDQVVDPRSAEMIRGKLGSEEKTLHMVPSRRHGILNEDIGDTHEKLLSFLASLAASASTDELMESV
ncbi:MAG: alpha/beta fold hydrolase [Proteobacteria bacterium]|nr:alpha/beta fold hydrolase [Pseudomonadota bacterium]